VLFSRFIPCGIFEAVHILDGLMANDTDIKPDTLHGDTHAQNASVFGLSHLLGIKLMPRIRNWKKLKLYKADHKYKYQNIESLFTNESIDWKLIETHLPELVRVAISIRDGKLIPSTILRRLTAKSKKNRLYLAFRELGYVIRSLFLLEHIGSRELRTKVHAATTRSEAFNDFLQWIFFGGDREIKKNDRDQQRKTIKYSHLLANLVILYNVQALSKAIRHLKDQGFHIDEELLAHTSPYMRSHINRFGEYRLDLNKKVDPLDFGVEEKLSYTFKSKPVAPTEQVILH
jgi:TnpA family transposase